MSVRARMANIPPSHYLNLPDIVTAVVLEPVILLTKAYIGNVVNKKVIIDLVRALIHSYQ